MLCFLVYITLKIASTLDVREERMIPLGLRAVQEGCEQAEVEDAVDHLLSPEEDTSEIRVRL